MKPFYLYILRCSDQSYYVGHTDDLEKRLLEQTAGKASLYTASRLPVFLVYSKKVWSRDEAFKAEVQIKKWTRKKKEALINGDLNGVSRLSKKKF
ncbi:GIY-YIG nuclease family protein [Candidatus Dependentiae bacterium]|nr:GIY-YIG nuclease family protein [Candidatus Dependentiae bacterium]